MAKNDKASLVRNEPMNHYLPQWLFCMLQDRCNKIHQRPYLVSLSNIALHVSDVTGIAISASSCGVFGEAGN